MAFCITDNTEHSLCLPNSMRITDHQFKLDIAYSLNRYKHEHMDSTACCLVAIVLSEFITKSER